LVGIDDAGNRSVVRFDITRDATPPAYVGHRVEPATIDGRSAIEITVEASDPSGLRSWAPYEALVGGVLIEGILERSGRSGTTYEAVVFTEAAAGTTSLTTVVLEDRLGNARRVELSR
jgi:hypothetical protein